MLTKLIKHEWKAVWKVPTALLVFLLLITLVGGISFLSPLWQAGADEIQPLAIIVLVFYYLSLIGVSLAISIYLAIRFYKNLYTDEGYLMHTLPVTKRQLILSKALVCSIWTILTSAATLFSILVLVAMAFGSLTPYGSDFQTEIRDIIISFETETGYRFSMIMLSFILMLIVSCISAVFMIYGSISFGQLFRKHKIMGSILSYIGIYMVLQMVASFAALPLTTRAIIAAETTENPAYFTFSVLQGTILITVFTSIALGIILYFITEYIMKKKLNLE